MLGPGSAGVWEQRKMQPAGGSAVEAAGSPTGGKYQCSAMPPWSISGAAQTGSRAHLVHERGEGGTCYSPQNPQASRAHAHGSQPDSEGPGMALCLLVWQHWESSHFQVPAQRRRAAGQGLCQLRGVSPARAPAAGPTARHPPAAPEPRKWQAAQKHTWHSTAQHSRARHSVGEPGAYCRSRWGMAQSGGPSIDLRS